MTERLSRLGARLGNWNDRRAGHHTRRSAPWPWRALDVLAGWLYVLPERGRWR